MASHTKTATAVDHATEPLFVGAGDSVSYTIAVGGGDSMTATAVLESSEYPSHGYSTVVTKTAVVAATTVVNSSDVNKYYRLRLTVHAGDDILFTVADVDTAADSRDSIDGDFFVSGRTTTATLTATGTTTAAAINASGTLTLTGDAAFSGDIDFTNAAKTLECASFAWFQQGLRTNQINSTFSSPPTKAEIDAVQGPPNYAKYGFIGALNHGSGTKYYIVMSDQANWWYVEMTKAV